MEMVARMPTSTIIMLAVPSNTAALQIWNPTFNIRSEWIWNKFRLHYIAELSISDTCANGSYNHRIEIGTICKSYTSADMLNVLEYYSLATIQYTTVLSRSESSENVPYDPPIWNHKNLRVFQICRHALYEEQFWKEIVATIQYGLVEVWIQKNLWI